MRQPTYSEKQIRNDELADEIALFLPSSSQPITGCWC